MLGLHGSKLIFTITLQDHSPEVFDMRQVKDSEKGVPADANDHAKRSFQEIHWAKHPRIHRFNDLAGFADVYWDGGTSTCVDYYFRGNRRKKYGRIIRDRSDWPVSSTKFYSYAHMVRVGGIPPNSPAEAKREAILDALSHVENTANQLKCYVDLSNERQVVESLDVEKMFAN